MVFRDNIGKEVIRGSICRDHWEATVVVACSDRVPVGGPWPLLLNISWRRRRDEGAGPPRPDDAQPITLSFRKRTPVSGGSISWDVAGTQATRGFPGDFDGWLDVYGKSPSSGDEPDVNLAVTIEGEERAAMPLSVGPLATLVEIRAENGTDPAPASIPFNQPTRLRAVAQPQIAGSTFRWLSATRELEIRGSSQAEVVEVVGRVPGPSTYIQPAKLYVLFTPPEGRGPAVMFAHEFELADLERMFLDHHLDRRHLQDLAYRRRLEAMRPPEVQRYVDQARQDRADQRITSYLDRLMEFVTQQEPLRAAPDGQRQNITFIVGTDPPRTDNPFYRAAEAFFTLQPAGTLIPARQLTAPPEDPSLLDMRDYLAAHPPSNGLPWGEINVVVHANEEGGMSIPVVPLQPGEDPQVHQANPRSLEEAVRGGRFQPLPDRLVDVRTMIRIRGCALGQSPEMLRRLSTAFGGDDAQRPVVHAPRHLQAWGFAPGSWTPQSNQPPTSSEEYFVEFWIQGFPRGQRPSARDLVARFRRDFPNANVDWARALANPGRPAGDTAVVEERTREYEYDSGEFVYRPIPHTAAQLTALVRTSIPNLAQAQRVTETGRAPAANGRIRITFDYELGGEQFEGATIEVGPEPPVGGAERLAFLRTQPVVVNDLARVGHTVDNYSWAFDLRDDANPDGTRRWRLLAHGRRTVLRVERELRELDPNQPRRTRRVHPAMTDPAHFGAEIPVREPSRPLGENVLVE